ncbi:ATP phosphoribosyltransferase regulatory subunit [Rhodomicrobium lacus]|uniref:ATP phosphoribosyltransferase regulatory subunit n=1 Tax=Rhodomicrobium TaxID=1068 RepID=UPI0026E1ED42|nr:ATP phosphoribosyltransferase regulatory subunit [Rhodomicrobium lacus]WKW49717.1 ATP phosphoribosyltransferase regulatory subunit [Rhodomicrobium lacus]
MTAEGAKEFGALEAQAATIMTLFAAKGYERVAPAFIQPASLFLDRIGEKLRARTYIFSDPSGEELCLRPDLTLPVARVFLERGAGDGVSKFSYNGPAFRIQTKPERLRTREFRQAGIEYYGARGIEADLEVMALTLDAVRSCGVLDFTIRVGHISLVRALLNALDMPQRWRDRLARAFRRQAFAQELDILSRSQADRAPALPETALTEDGFLAHLDTEGVPFIGLRRPAEIVKRLQHKAADAQELPLSAETVRLARDYLATRGDVDTALDRIASLAAEASLDLGPVMDDARALLGGIKKLAGCAPVIFEADFGRHFEYYTGMVFRIDAAGVERQIAGGGRYDGLIRALSGGARDVPAVGAAIHTERLLVAASGR